MITLNSFVSSPNLPTKPVATVAVSGLLPNVVADLTAMGIRCLSAPPFHTIQTGVSQHADMLLHHLGGAQIICATGCDELHRTLYSCGFDVITSHAKLQETYPLDVALNGCRVGDKLFCNTSHLDDTIKQYCFHNQIQLVSVRQGYTKCSICVVDEHSIITSDMGIAQAAMQQHLNVLTITSGHIQLPPYDYGFIGGCCGKLSHNTIYFTGKLNAHPDGQRIKEFIQRCNVSVLEGSCDMLFDVGGILPLKY